MHKALHSKDDIDIFYISRKEGGSGLASIEEGVDTTQWFEKYAKKAKKY